MNCSGVGQELLKNRLGVTDELLRSNTGVAQATCCWGLSILGVDQESFASHS